MSTIAVSTSLAMIKALKNEGLNSKQAFRVRPAWFNKAFFECQIIAAALLLGIEGFA